MDHNDSDVEVVAAAGFESTVRLEPDRTVFVGRFPLSTPPEKLCSPVVEDAKASSMVD
jgi:hypothetical protein